MNTLGTLIVIDLWAVSLMLVLGFSTTDSNKLGT